MHHFVRIKSVNRHPVDGHYRQERNRTHRDKREEEINIKGISFVLVSISFPNPSFPIVVIIVRDVNSYSKASLCSIRISHSTFLDCSGFFVVICIVLLFFVIRLRRRRNCIRVSFQVFFLSATKASARD